MIDKYVKVGTTVAPRMQGMDCAVVIAIEQSPDTGNVTYSVLTDFGNILELTHNEFNTLYQNERYLAELPYNGDLLQIYQDPFNFSVEDRFMRQVELMKQAQEVLLAKGLLHTKYIF